MSTTQTNNQNKTGFNIIMENGLAYKPIIRCEAKVYTQKGNEKAAIIHLNIVSDELDSRIEDFQCQRTVIDESEIYVDIGDYYLVGWHGSELVTQSAREKNVAVKFYRNGNFLFWMALLHKSPCCQP